MTGHIIGMAKLVQILKHENNQKIWFKIHKRNLQKYLIHKDSIGIDGVSLTLSAVMQNYFAIFLIPKTLQYTTLGLKKYGDIVNIEINMKTKIIVDTIERELKNILTLLLLIVLNILIY